MATAVVMPKLGNTVETSIIANWKKQKGDPVAAGDILCEIETDKATIDVESPASGTLLELFFKAGDEVPVMTTIAAIGQPGENVDALWPANTQKLAVPVAQETSVPVASNGRDTTVDTRTMPGEIRVDEKAGISPRARHLAENKALNVDGIQGTGPGGRIIERDIQAALAAQPKLTPLAKSMVSKGEFALPPQGTGPGGRITSKDLMPPTAAPAPAAPTPQPASVPDEVTVIPVKGMRKVIATRMLASMQTTAQLTLNSFADARALQAYRKRLKSSPAALGVQDVTINDLVLYAASRTLLQFPDLNALFADEAITQYKTVHLGFAVDTPRGLIVPVIHNASKLSLKEISQTAKRLATACQDGTILPDDMSGGTFTVTNLGNMGIETFTPVLNVPQVAILGVGNISLKPVEVDGDVAFIPHLGLSLTINHQVVDGAPGARFLQALAKNLAELELLLAL
ncbi:MAG: 2-oxo acid dehydrogenase subunit E2 [Anaerolineae bacterium]|nr:2-oxo acid dehydrogenase subunit E2 [Anaerolineae bacterium]